MVHQDRPEHLGGCCQEIDPNICRNPCMPEQTLFALDRRHVQLARLSSQKNCDPENICADLYSKVIIYIFSLPFSKNQPSKKDDSLITEDAPCAKTDQSDYSKLIGWSNHSIIGTNSPLTFLTKTSASSGYSPFVYSLASLIFPRQISTTPSPIGYQQLTQSSRVQ